LGRRLRQLANEREKLLRAYYADAIDAATLKREQAQINAEVAEAESQLARDGEKLWQATKIIDLAFDLAKDRAASYRKAKPEVRKLWTKPSSARSSSRTARSRTSRTRSPSRPFLGSHKGSMVEVTGQYSNSLGKVLQELLSSP
jgi:predicted  nucleic acid-binding Zn-ribbon protein